MRRLAMVLATVGLVAVGMAATPARAHDGWWGYPEWRENGWREHHRYGNPGYYGDGSYGPPAYYQPGVTLGADFR